MQQVYKDEIRHVKHGARWLKEWSGQEPALQLLWLPSASSNSLPQYPTQPEFVDPEHCRLCLEPLGSGGIEKHLEQKHPGFSFHSYRTHVLRSAITAWPEARLRISNISANLTLAQQLAWMDGVLLTCICYLTMPCNFLLTFSTE